MEYRSPAFSNNMTDTSSNTQYQGTSHSSLFNSLLGNYSTFDSPLWLQNMSHLMHIPFNNPNG